MSSPWITSEQADRLYRAAEGAQEVMLSTAATDADKHRAIKALNEIIGEIKELNGYGKPVHMDKQAS